MKKAIKFYILALTLLFVGLTAFSASAQTGACPQKAFYNLEIKLPGMPSSVCGPADYLSGIYKLAVGIAVVLAAIMIVYGGIIWSTSGGNPSRQKEARSHITQAIFGLVILLASYLILNTINPALVNLGALQSRIQGKAEISLPPAPPPQVSEFCKICTQRHQECYNDVNKKWNNGEAARYQELKNKCDADLAACQNAYCK